VILAQIAVALNRLLLHTSIY